MAQSADDVNLSEQLHLLKVIHAQAQSEFENSHQIIESVCQEANSSTIVAYCATDSIRLQILSAFGAAAEEFKAASALAAKISSIIQSKVSSGRPPRMATRTHPPNPYGTPIIRSPQEDIWRHRPSAPFPPGSQVAALTDEHSDPNLWIQAQVVSYDPLRCRYTVIDKDAEGDGTIHQSKDYIIDCDRLLLLPSLAEVPAMYRYEFHKDECVLAIFPATTVFYPAIVVSPPRKSKGYYILQFADDDTNQRRVPSQHVVPLPARYYNSAENLSA